MDSMTAFMMGEANRNKELMVFDWDEAARIIKASSAKLAEAGLSGDWEYTGGVIYNEKPIMDEYTYLASTWAKPELMVDGEVIDCYKMQSLVPEWGCETKWPQSSLDILNENEPTQYRQDK